MDFPWQNSETIRDQLLKEGWRTEDTYCNYFEEIKNFSAIYLFLLHDHRLVWASPDKAFIGYVGMATRLKQRLLGHPILNEIYEQFEHFYAQRWFLRTPIVSLRQVERKHIQRFNPPWNIIGRQRGINNV